MAIDHDPLSVMRTIERYLGGELSPEEQQEWEEHYFQCAQCFETLEATAQIREHFREEARVRLREGSRPASRHRVRLRALTLPQWLLPAPAWRPSLAAAAAAIIVAIPATMGWLRVASLRQEVRQLRMPGAASLSYVLDEGVRGVEPAVTIPVDAGRFLLQFNLVGEEREATTRTARIRDASGRVVWAGAGLAGQGPYGTFVISCQSSFFNPGDYELMVDEVRRDDGTVLNSSVFAFRVTGATRQGTGQ
jgi:hypothetical protein